MLNRLATLVGYSVFLMILLSLFNLGTFSMNYSYDNHSKIFFSTHQMSIVNTVKSWIK